MSLKPATYLRWFIVGGLISLSWLIFSLLCALITTRDPIFVYLFTGFMDGWAVTPWSDFLAWVSRTFYGSDYVPPALNTLFPMWQFLLGGFLGCFIRAIVVLWSLFTQHS
jgi:hypothetical protein